MTESAICGIRLAIFALLLGLCTPPKFASADEAEARTALRAGPGMSP